LRLAQADPPTDPPTSAYRRRQTECCLKSECAHQVRTHLSGLSASSHLRKVRAKPLATGLRFFFIHSPTPLVRSLVLKIVDTEIHQAGRTSCGMQEARDLRGEKAVPQC
jgi:hypothetical protein